MQKNDRETYDKFFEKFGLQLKYGLYAGWGMNKELLQDLVMFKSAKEDKYVTLKEYISALGDEDKNIYYCSGKTVAAVKALPQCEKALKDGKDVLCFTDDVDEFAVKMLGEYEGKQFKNVLSEEVSASKEDDEKTEQDKDMLGKIKDALGDKVSKVKVSSAIGDHAVCLSSEGEVSLEMEKVLNSMPGAEEKVKANKVRELNPAHPIYEKLKAVYGANPDDIADYAEVLYQSARLVSGLNVEDPTAVTDKMFALLAK